MLQARCDAHSELYAAELEERSTHRQDRAECLLLSSIVPFLLRFPATICYSGFAPGRLNLDDLSGDRASGDPAARPHENRHERELPVPEFAKPVRYIATVAIFGQCASQIDPTPYFREDRDGPCPADLTLRIERPALREAPPMGIREWKGSVSPGRRIEGSRRASSASRSAAPILGRAAVLSALLLTTGRATTSSSSLRTCLSGTRSTTVRAFSST